MNNCIDLDFLQRRKSISQKDMGNSRWEFTSYCRWSLEFQMFVCFHSIVLDELIMNPDYFVRVGGLIVAGEVSWKTRFWVYKNCCIFAKSQPNSKIRFALERLNLGLSIGVVMCDFNPIQSNKNNRIKIHLRKCLYFH